jgi:membrane associated rhomboid family serine protease
MFIPIGDNIDRRTFPLVTVLLIVANAAVFAIQLRTSYDAVDALERKAAAAVVLPGAAPVSRGQWDGDFDDEFGNLEEYPWEPAYDDSEWMADMREQQAAILAAQKAQYEFIKRWGLTPTELRQGQVMGLLTHMFLHGDIFHLLGNMLMLWAFAGALEAGFGHLTFLGFYILFGFAGGLAQCATNMSSDIPLIGASGAIAGLIGSYLVLYGPLARLKMLFFFFYRAWVFEMPAAAFCFGWFLLQMLQASVDEQTGGGIAWFAHIGGFMAGVVVTFICRHDTEQEVAADVDGRLQLQHRDPQAAARPAAGTTVASPRPAARQTHCPYCQTELTEGHALAVNLIRCGNPSCERMVYLEAASEADLAGAGKRR